MAETEARMARSQQSLLGIVQSRVAAYHKAAEAKESAWQYNCLCTSMIVLLIPHMMSPLVFKKHAHDAGRAIRMDRASC
jgi:hypothetical protein